MARALWTVLSLFCIALFVLGVVMQLRTWRKQRAVRPWMIVLGQLAAFVSMAAFSVLTARPPGPVSWVLLLGLGGLGGLVYGRFVRVVRTAAGVQMSYTLPWIVTWSVLMVLTQFNAAVFRRVPVVLYGFAIVNLGLNLGMNASVLRAYRRATVVAASLVIGAWALAGDAVRAQATEEPAVVDAVLIRPGTPAFEDVKRITGVLSVWGSGAPIATSGGHLYARLFGAGRAGTGVLRLLVFADARDADARLREVGEQTNPSCRRLVEDRYVIELVGVICTGAYPSKYRDPVLDVLEAAANRAIRGSPAPPPVVVREEPPDDRGELPAKEEESAMLPHTARTEPERENETPPSGSEETRDDGDSETRGEGEAETAGGERPADGEYPPLAPEDAAAAVAVSSLTLLGGSLLQLLPGLLGSRPIGDVAAVPPPPPAPPLDPAEEYARQMEAQGYHWSDRDGWVTDEQAREYQGQRDRAWQEHLKQDAELARIEGEIRKAREAQEAARAAQAEYDRKLALMERQRQLEAEQAAVLAEVQQRDWAGRAVDAIQMAADTAIGEIAEVTGPVGQAIRAGYNAAKGMATVVGEAIAEGRGLKAADIRRGVWLAAENIAMDMGLDAAVRKVTGQPGLFEEAANAGADAARGAARAAEAVTDPKLVAKARDMREAIDLAKKGDKDAILKLYENHGMKDLAELERAGQISVAEAKRLNAVLSDTVDRAVDRGTREAVDLWEKGNPGVKLKEVLVADSGSSAVRGKARSVLTDFDRTTVPVFDPDDVRKYAANRGITPAQAHQELTQQFKSIHEKAVGEALPGGLTAKDVDYKSYGGFGAKSGQADSYPAGFANTRQATQGRTTVYPPDGGRPHAASREASVDQWNMEVAKHGGPPPAEIGPRIAPQEFPAVAKEQVKAIVEKGDPKSVAKAVDRLAYMGQRSEVRVTGHAMDEGLVRIAAEIKKSPQGVPGILERAGLSEEEFAKRALEEARRLEGTVAGWDRPPVGG